MKIVDMPIVRLWSGARAILFPFWAAFVTWDVRADRVGAALVVFIFTGAVLSDLHALKFPESRTED